MKTTEGLLVLLVMVSGLQWGSAECDARGESPVPRTFYYVQKGYPFTPTNATTALKVLEGCYTTESLIHEAIQFFASYGVDASALRRNPFDTYEDEYVKISSLSGNPDSDGRLLISTFYEYASYQGTRVDRFAWIGVVKRDHSGDAGTITSGSRILMIIMKFIDNGDAFCLLRRDIFTNPVGTYQGQAYARNIEVKNKVWGTGNGTVFGDQSLPTPIFSVMIEFPGKNFN